MNSKPEDTNPITVESGKDVYVRSEHFDTKLVPFSNSFQFKVQNDVGNYYMAISYTTLPELIRFLEQVSGLVENEPSANTDEAKKPCNIPGCQGHTAPTSVNREDADEN